MTWYVYIAETRVGYFYTGITTDPEHRIVKHNSGEGAQLAIDQGPFTLKYVSSPFKTKSSARKREIQVKDWSQDKKLKLISGEWN